jgi:hypothetical protein
VAREHEDRFVSRREQDPLFFNYVPRILSDSMLLDSKWIDAVSVEVQRNGCNIE